MKVYNTQYCRDIHLDFTTKNVSFLKVAAVLQAEAVKNYCFFLQLNDKGLKGVDPYDPELSTEMQFRVFKECITNRWYFYREVFRVSAPGAGVDVGGGISFKLSRGNLAYLWAMSLNISAYLIMPRQTGKTWAAIADAVWTHQFVRGSNLLHFNKSQGDANDNLQRIQDSIRMLPMYLQHSNLENLDPKDKRRVKNNQKTIRNAINGTIEAMASAGNEAKADAIARGRTAAKIWYDELAFIFFNETIYAAAMPAYAKAAELAEEHDAPYAISITTTPGDLATPHGQFAYKMMDSSIQFDEFMYDMKRKKLFDVINNTPDKTRFVFIQFSYLQLGETEDWYLERAKDMHNPVRARREFLLEWINTNGNSPFDPDDIETIGDESNQRALNATTFKINKYYNLHVYDEYNGKKPVIISVDVSGGLGRDSTAVVVIHPENLKPLAFFRSNMIPSDQLKKLLVTLVNKRYPNCILTIENNSVGKPLLDELRDTSIARVLYREKKKRQIDQGVNNFTKKKTREIIEYGHNTNPTTRAQMMEMLESIVHNAHSHVAYPELYEEIRHLELKNGRIDHNSATHDDCTMAYLGGLWVIRYGSGTMLKRKGIYYILQDGLDEDEENRYDISATLSVADRLILNKEGSITEVADDIINHMSRDQHIEDSGTLAQKEREKYFRALDQIEGIEDEETELDASIDAIPDSTQRMLLRNYRSIMGSNNNPLNMLVDTDDDDNIFDAFREKEDWSSLYKY